MAVLQLLDRSWGDKVCMRCDEDTNLYDMDWPTVKSILNKKIESVKGVLSCHTCFFFAGLPIKGKHLLSP